MNERLHHIINVSRVWMFDELYVIYRVFQYISRKRYRYFGYYISLHIFQAVDFKLQQITIYPWLPEDGRLCEVDKVLFKWRMRVL